MKKLICLYLHVHQPYRIKHYTIFDAGKDPNYFNNSNKGSLTNNEFILNKVAEKSYLKTNKILLDLLLNNPEFKLSLSITGTVIEQFEKYAPDVLDSFIKLVKTGRVEIVAETYHHSLAFFYSINEFESQVKMHEEKIKEVFDFKPAVFRNTELSYNNDLAIWAENNGYRGIIAEGWDPILDWRSPNYIYKPKYSNDIRLLLKNYRLSDDIAFRFGDRNWSEYPMSPEKFIQWLNQDVNSDIFNLFMDYETFGEHQWEETGIFEFLKNLPHQWISQGNGFSTLSEAINSLEVKDEIDVPNTITWADSERDLTAWLGNSMQQEAINAIYNIENKVLSTGDLNIIEDWRKLQTSDHFYYMCTKWFSDGDVHAYFSPYSSPYEAFINYMNCWHDLNYRINRKRLA